jgi:hypothetical protein
MSSFIIFILSCWGLTHLLIVGKILDQPRNWIMIKSSFFQKLLECYQCTGFWVGIFFWTILKDLPHLTYFYHLEWLKINANLSLDFLVYALISSGAIPAINSVYVIINRLIDRINRLNKQ